MSDGKPIISSGLVFFPDDRTAYERLNPRAQFAVSNAVEAIEAFTAAKIHYERRLTTDPNWASTTDLDETREHMRDKLAEVLT